MGLIYIFGSKIAKKENKNWNWTNRELKPKAPPPAREPHLHCTITDIRGWFHWNLPAPDLKLTFMLMVPDLASSCGFSLCLPWCPPSCPAAISVLESVKRSTRQTADGEPVMCFPTVCVRDFQKWPTKVANPVSINAGSTLLSSVTYNSCNFGSLSSWMHSSGQRPRKGLHDRTAGEIILDVPSGGVGAGGALGGAGREGCLVKCLHPRWPWPCRLPSPPLVWDQDV